MATQAPKKRVFIDAGSHDLLSRIAERDKRTLSAELEWLIEQEAAERSRADQPEANGVHAA